MNMCIYFTRLWIYFALSIAWLEGTIDTGDWRSYLPQLRKPRGAPIRLPNSRRSVRTPLSSSRSSRRFYRFTFDPAASFWQIVSRNSASLETFFYFRCDLLREICLMLKTFFVEEKKKIQILKRTFIIYDYKCNIYNFIIISCYKKFNYYNFIL